MSVEITPQLPPTVVDVPPAGPKRVAHWLRLFFSPGDVFEVRALECSTPKYRRSHTEAGYFDYHHIEEAAKFALDMGGREKNPQSKGVYFTINPVNPVCLQRRVNKIEPAGREYHGTTDIDIVNRRWLMIDCDPVYIAGVSSSNAEHAHSRDTALRVRDYLTADGWPTPIYATSGNGHHLLYRIDQPIEDGGIVKKCLHALAAKFDNEHVKIDRSVFNPARICKLYGTIARKGEPSQDRPHRRSEILEFDPSGVQQVVPASLVKKLAATEPVDAIKRSKTPTTGGTRTQNSKSATTIERALAYVATCKPAISGQKGSDVAYWLAGQLVVEFDLSNEDAFFVISGEWNQRCQPPWSEKELRHKIEQADKNGTGERGGFLKAGNARRNHNLPDYSSVEFPEFHPGTFIPIEPTTVAKQKITLQTTATPVSPPIDLNSAAPFGLLTLDDILNDDTPAGSVTAQPQGNSTEPYQGDDDPERLATLFMRTYDYRGLQTLRFWRCQWRLWSGMHYELISDDQLEAWVTNRCQREFTELNIEKIESARKNPHDEGVTTALKVTKTLVGNVTLHLKSICLIADTIEAPSWIGDMAEQFQGRNSRDFISMANGILDVKAYLENELQAPEPIPHTPDYFSTSTIPYPFQPSATHHGWDRFLSQNLQLHDPTPPGEKFIPGRPILYNEDLHNLLQEWFGYCLTADTTYQKFLMLEGEGRNGKSVICAALTAMLGAHNVSHVPLELFGGQFSLYETIGKTANIVAEVGEMEKTAEGALKSFTSGDAMTFDRKYKDAITAIPTAKLVLATNNRPRFSDKSGGLWRRLLILPLTYQVPDSERTYGLDTAHYWAPECSGILNWALDGLRKLRDQGRFTEPKQSKDAADDYQASANPARLFLEDHYEFTDPNTNWVVSSDIYAAYKEWCKVNTYSPMNSLNFGKEIRRRFPGAVRAQIRNEGQRVWVYYGLRPIHDIETTTYF